MQPLAWNFKIFFFLEKATVQLSETGISIIQTHEEFWFARAVLFNQLLHKIMNHYEMTAEDSDLYMGLSIIRELIQGNPAETTYAFFFLALTDSCFMSGYHAYKSFSKDWFFFI